MSDAIARLRASFSDDDSVSFAGANPIEDVKVLLAEHDRLRAQVEDARKSLQIADRMVSDHIERFHDYDYRPEEQPPELASLHQIEHHLMGSLILDDDISSLTSTVRRPVDFNNAFIDEHGWVDLSKDKDGNPLPPQERKAGV